LEWQGSDDYNYFTVKGEYAWKCIKAGNLFMRILKQGYFTKGGENGSRYIFPNLSMVRWKEKGCCPDRDVVRLDQILRFPQNDLLGKMVRRICIAWNNQEKALFLKANSWNGSKTA
jgi:hypothetical protein